MPKEKNSGNLSAAIGQSEDIRYRKKKILPATPLSQNDECTELFFQISKFKKNWEIKKGRFSEQYKVSCLSS